MSADILREKIWDLLPQAKADLARMVSFKSVHDDKQFPPDECRRMVDFLVGAFSDIGLRDLRGYQTADGSQAVIGHRSGPPGSPTVLLYFHHDVQPPLDDAAWSTPVWQLSERDGRWYGRGAADCKGNIAMQLLALRASATTCRSASRSSARARRSRALAGWKHSFGSTPSAAIQPDARARINLRVPPGMDAKKAQTALTDHLTAVAPWHVQLELEREADGAPFPGTLQGPGYEAIRTAMRRRTAATWCCRVKGLGSAVQRLRRDIPRGADHAPWRGGTTLPHPCA